MNLGSLLLAALSAAVAPGHAQAVSTETMRDIAIIDNLIQTGNRLDGQMEQAEQARRVLDRFGSDADKASADRRIRDLKNKRDLEWSAAMFHAVKVFKIAKLPLGGTGTIAPLDGVPMQWRMTVGNREERKIKDKHGSDYTLPAADPSFLAVTDIDGTTTVFTETFRKFGGKVISAAELGLLLLHERVHFKNVTSPSTGLTRAQAEIEARATVLRHLDLFPIKDPESRRKALKEEIRQFQKAERGEAPDVRYQAVMRFYDTVPGSMYNPRELAAIEDRTVEAMGRADEEERLSNGPESLKARGEYEFLDGWRGQAAALSKRIERSRERARQEQARREHERKQQEENIRLVREAARNCGFQADGPDIRNFRVASAPAIKLRFRYRDVGQAHAALLVAAACLWPDDRAACTDGIEIMSRRWGDAGFRDSILMGAGTHDFVLGCLDRIARYAVPPRDYDWLRREADTYGLNWRDRKARQREREERERRSDEHRSSPAPQSSPSRGDGDDTFWSPELQHWIRRVPRR